MTRLRYHLSFDHCTKTGTWILSSLPLFSSPFKDVNLDVNFIRTERIPWNSFSLEFRVVANRFTDGVAKSRVYSSNATVTVLKLNDATAGKLDGGGGEGSEIQGKEKKEKVNFDGRLREISRKIL